ncbi:MAG: hypothetical protein WC516_07555 [Patescibacteria group bacterium]
MLRFKKDQRKELVTQGIVAGLVEVAYIVLVALFFLFTQIILPANSGGLVIFGMIALLILLVFSVALSGAIVFGHSLHYLWQKKYQEAMTVFFATMLTMLASFLVVVAIAVIFSFVK